MSVGPSFSFDLYPGLDAELQAAYERNVGNASPADIANAGLAAVVQEQIAEADPLANANLLHDFRSSLDKAQADAAAIFKDVRGVPALTDERFAGLNWERLQNAYEAMHSRNLEPRVVFTPSNMQPFEWRNVFATLPNTKNGGLYIDEDVENDNIWPNLNVAHERWSLTVISGLQEPTATNVNHSLSAVDGAQVQILDDLAINGLKLPKRMNIRDYYPTINEYLTLQASLLMAGEQPVDTETSSWLNGTFGDNSAPYAYLNPDNAQVDVRWNDVDNRNDNLGVRPAVRE